MKILMLGVKEYPYGSNINHEKYLGGGIGKIVIELSKELTRQGNEVTFIVRKMPDQKPMESAEGFTILRVPWVKGKLFRTITFNFFAVIKARRIAHEYDIIHSHGVLALFSSLFFLKKYNNKLVACPHGGPLTRESGYNFFVTFVFRLIERYALINAPYLIYTSGSEKLRLEKEYNIKKDFPVLYTGLTAGEIGHPGDFDNKQLRLLFVGRLVPRKGIAKLLDAFGFFPDEVKQNICLKIVGDGSQRKELEEIVERKNLNNIVFEGFQKQVSRYFIESDLLVLPTDGKEGLPFSVLEAMSVGLPCMITNFGNVFSDEAVISLSSNSPEILADNIVKLYYNRELLVELSNNAKKEFKEVFDIKIAGKNYCNEYQHITNKDEHRKALKH